MAEMVQEWDTPGIICLSQFNEEAMILRCQLVGIEALQSRIMEEIDGLSEARNVEKTKFSQNSGTNSKHVVA